MKLNNKELLFPISHSELLPTEWCYRCGVQSKSRELHYKILPINTEFDSVGPFIICEECFNNLKHSYHLLNASLNEEQLLNDFLEWLNLDYYVDTIHTILIAMGYSINGRSLHHCSIQSHLFPQESFNVSYEFMISLYKIFRLYHICLTDTIIQQELQTHDGANAFISIL